jgi:hypothetical protein
MGSTSHLIVLEMKSESQGVVEKNVRDSRRLIWIEARERKFGSFAELNAWLSERRKSGMRIRRYAKGLYCINDLHRAAGGETRNQPSNFLRTEQAVELWRILADPAPQIRGTQETQSKQGLGKYVSKERVCGQKAESLFGVWQTRPDAFSSPHQDFRWRAPQQPNGSRRRAS